jgi:hypothetical protein
MIETIQKRLFVFVDKYIFYFKIILNWYFLGFFNNFNMLILKIIFLMHFKLKITYKKHHILYYQTHMKSVFWRTYFLFLSVLGLKKH